MQHPSKPVVPQDTSKQSVRVGCPCGRKHPSDSIEWHTRCPTLLYFVWERCSQALRERPGVDWVGQRPYRVFPTLHAIPGSIRGSAGCSGLTGPHRDDLAMQQQIRDGSAERNNPWCPPAPNGNEAVLHHIDALAGRSRHACAAIKERDIRLDIQQHRTFRAGRLLYFNSTSYCTLQRLCHFTEPERAPGGSKVHSPDARAGRCHSSRTGGSRRSGDSRYRDRQDTLLSGPNDRSDGQLPAAAR